MSDSLQRLSCYDGMAPQPVAAATNGYQAMTLIDWKTDKVQLGRSGVEVEGLIMPFAEHALLSTKVGDSSPVWIGVGSIPRDQRRRLLACAPYCQVTVRGHGGSVMGQDGLVADALTFR